MSNLADLYGVPVSLAFNSYKILESIRFGEKTKIITFVNPHSYYLMTKIDSYKETLLNFDYILCDGIGVAKLASKYFKKDINRYSFDDTSLAPIVFDYCNLYSLRVGVIGASGEIYTSFCDKLSDNYPNVIFEPISNGYESSDSILGMVGSKRFDIILIGMGIPKQEELATLFKSGDFNIGLIFTCGGYLDQKCASENYYPKLVDKFNIRFLYRIYKEPKRLWRRYLLEYRNFIKIYLLSFIK